VKKLNSRFKLVRGDFLSPVEQALPRFETTFFGLLEGLQPLALFVMLFRFLFLFLLWSPGTDVLFRGFLFGRLEFFFSFRRWPSFSSLSGEELRDGRRALFFFYLLERCLSAHASSPLFWRVRRIFFFLVSGFGFPAWPFAGRPRFLFLRGH